MIHNLKQQRHFEHHHHNFCRPKQILHWISSCRQPYRQSICVHTKFCWLRIPFYIGCRKFVRKYPWIFHHISLKLCFWCSSIMGIFFGGHISCKHDRIQWLIRLCCTWQYHIHRLLGNQIRPSVMIQNHLKVWMLLRIYQPC